MFEKNKISLYWWISPYGITLFFLIPIYILIFMITRDSTIAGVKNYIDNSFFIIGLFYLMVFASISYFSSKVQISRREELIKGMHVSPFFMDFIAVTTIIAYIIWFGEVILNPNLLITILMGQGGTDGVRNYISTIPGITTLSQLGIVYTIFFINHKIINKDIFPSKRYYLYFYVIIILTLFRVILWSERLALIELIVPLIVIYLTYGNKKIIYEPILKFAPYFGVVILLVFFGVTEYFRSWNYYKNYYSSLSEFVIERVSYYYSTSLNNGAGVVTEFGIFNGDFWFILNWLYKMPIIGDRLMSLLQIQGGTGSFLTDYGNAEFNNPSGLFIIIYDLGIVGALLYIIFYAILSGLLYRSFIRKNGLGLFLYPIFFISNLEFLRILYLSETRTFPILLFITLGYIFATKFKISKT